MALYSLHEGARLASDRTAADGQGLLAWRPRRVLAPGQFYRWAVAHRQIATNWRAATREWIRRAASDHVDFLDQVVGNRCRARALPG